MFDTIMTKVFGSKEDRDVKKFTDIVEAVNQREPAVKKLTDAQLQAKTPHFRQQIESGATLDELLPDAFAVVREAAVRTLKQRHYDVQIIGGVALHSGSIAEMRTGEGKTLTSTLAVYLNALTGNGVHLATVNDYLAQRDAEWMGQIYNFLGMSVGLTLNQMPYEQRQLAYKADITYGVHSQFGFDYLNDNRALTLDSKVQRGHIYAILDEVDSILIDEARTPLIISDASDKPAELYRRINHIVTQLRNEEHFVIDDKGKSRGNVSLTDDGIEEVQRLLGITNMYEPDHVMLVHHVNQALNAHHLWKRDIDYLVENGEVLLIDEFTGRKLVGRRLNEGLHQAIEAKERVRIAQESETFATITYQNYFRLYDKLAGMTGTAATEANEFAHIYGLDVVVVPTNEPMIRIDNPDQIYRTEETKYNAVLEDIQEQHEKGRPVLVGTISIENSEKLSKLLRARHRNIKHQVLNAKEHAREADIIAQAGMPGAVTIATNMAGRGVDILLGGNPEGLAKETLRKKKVDLKTLSTESEEWQTAFADAEAICENNKKHVLNAGGLHIVGTERHDSRRIDNQLRGRSGRQGDPGSSRFYLSLEDDLMRKFGSERLQGLMTRAGINENIPLEHPWVTKSIEKAQTRVEQINFEARKNILKYDDVMEAQRDTIYSLRDSILSDEDPKDTVWNMIDNVVADEVYEVIPEKGPREPEELAQFEKWLVTTFSISPMFKTPLKEISADELHSEILNELKSVYKRREEELGAENMRLLERLLVLNAIDHHWKDHLQNIDYIQHGIRFEGYGGKDPIVVFKSEALGTFESMYQNIEKQVSEFIFKMEVTTQPARRVPERRQSRQRRPAQRRRPDYSSQSEAEFASQQAMGTVPKVGRNELCPCGSGVKYKKCHGR
ncbi:preprotein translocase subunit SecA [Candidatus Poribacteria bacterium]|nr:preprotein translocase subunit SecA [Candidatus Poribacteria bacterium]MYB64769.1 preprotein translocase subunit SecA [Candidatus Poribacteria bacterium]MYF57399.1 preprotein translocase subunit SecA [Candidatus Poribacteria bacterium]